MQQEGNRELQLEIAYVLFIDIVGYSKLVTAEQHRLIELLNQIVRGSEHFRKAEANHRVVTVPSGDGMALVFYNTPEAPAECALEIAASAQKDTDEKGTPQLRLRMGIHSGPVSGVIDVGGHANIAGAGINMAQRVMDCGDTGHILVSKHLAEDLEQYGHWKRHLHDLGEMEVKHGVRLSIVNLYTEDHGNPELPQKVAQARHKAEVPLVHERSNKKWIPAAVVIALIAAALIGYQLVRSRTSAHVEGGAPATPDNATAGATGLAGAFSIPAKSVAVLPFENLSENKENAFFADGVQDEILTNLAKVADLKVISRTSVIGYRDTAGRNLRKIGEELGVAHVVEGSVQRAANKVRVNAQLIDARNDAHLWAQTYDRDLADVFAIQSEIAKAIADQLQARLSPQEKAEIDRAPTTNLTAFDLYTRAKQLSERGSYSTQGSEFTRQGVELLNQAVALDPNFFLAYLQLQYAHQSLYFFNVDRTPARRALGEAALKAAIRLRPDAGETHLAIAGGLYRINLDYDGARAELEKARQTLPNNSQLYEWTGYIDRRQGRWEESVRSHRRALELDPRNHFLYQQISLTYAHLRSYREMAAAVDQTLKLIPGDIESRLARGAVDLLERADTEPLNRTIHDILEHNPDGENLVAEQWFYVADARRDVIEGDRAASALPATGLTQNGLVFPRPFCRAIFARLRGDQAAMRDLLLEARKETELKLQASPDYGPTLLVLGLIDAGLGRKDDAIREGRRAAELMPITKESIAGANIITNLAVIYAWTGEKDLALDELAKSASIPAGVSYGELKGESVFDSLHGDPRFEKLLASLAPK